MAWTNPRTWSDGLVVTGAIMNTEVRDNLNFLHGPPAAKATQSTGTNVPDITWTTINFDAEAWDNASMHSTATNTSRLTPTAAGKYLIVAQVGWSSTSVTVAGARLTFNGVTTVIGQQSVNTSTSVGPYVNLSTVYAFNGSSDYVVVQGYQDSSGSLTTNTGATFLSATWICE